MNRHRPQAPAFHGAGAEVLDQHVGVFHQRAQDVLTFSLCQVQRHGLFVARLDFPPDRVAVLQQPPFAQRVALARRFDLDDFGAEVAQRLAAEGSGDELAEFEDAHAGERAGYIAGLIG